MTTFYKDPLVQIIDELNAKNAATLARPLVPTDIKISEVSSDSETGARDVVVSAAPGSGFFGAIRNPDVTYKRYVGEKLFVTGARIWADPGDHADVVLQRFAQAYNLPPFTIEPAEGDTENPYDFDKSYRDKVPLPDGYSAVFNPNFRNDSIGYVGGIQIDVYNSSSDLGKVMKEIQIGHLTYPDNTKGMTGSLSTLTYPIQFSLPASSKGVLGIVGEKLSTELTDPTVAAMIDQIFGYYENSNTNIFQRSDLEAVIPGATVAETNLIGDGGVENTEDVLIVLDAVVAENAKFTGQIIIRSPNFE